MTAIDDGKSDGPWNGRNLPRGWRTVCLSEVAEIVMGNSPPGDTYNEKGIGTPLVNGPVEFSNGPLGLTIRSKFTTSPTKFCQKGDLLICVRGSTTGRTNLAAFDACIGRGVAAIRAHEHQSYLNQFICTQRSRVFAAGKGSTFPSLSQQQLCDIEMPLPPLTEQKRIAAILDKADAIRRKRQETCSLTNDLPLAVFRKTFKAFLGPNRVENRLGEVAEVVSGVAKGRKLNGGPVREVPYLRVANVQAGFLDLSEIKTIPAKQSEVDALALEHGDVVMTEGGDYDKLGRGALWDQDLPDCIHQNHVFRVRTNREQLLPTFFVHYLQTQAATNYFLRCAKKTTNLASINMTQLRALPVPHAPLGLQKKFDKELATIREVAFRQQNSAKEAADLFDCLVQRAFKGQL